MSVVVVDPASAAYVELIRGLHGTPDEPRWTPNPFQRRVGHAFFQEMVREVFAEAGRNTGKTELICYLLWRFAKQFPGSENYYFAPLQKQAREILWETNRIQPFGPQEWLLEGSKGTNETEARLTFTNSSYIKLDGSDNVDAYRGVKLKKKGLLVLDEFKDFKPDFWLAVEPNIVDASVFLVGTPPEPIEDENGKMPQFIAVADEFKRNPRKRYFHGTTLDNPHFPRERVEAKREELYELNEGYVFEREYMAKRVMGGRSKIFPHLSKVQVVQHAAVMRELAKDWKKLTWWIRVDPGSTTVFAALFGAFNPFTRKRYYLDEIYETDQGKMTALQIGREIFRKRDELCARVEWDQRYDEAAAWFANELNEHFGDQEDREEGDQEPFENTAFMPTQKSLKSKEEGISHMRDSMRSGLWVVSDRCKKFLWELSKYEKDIKGAIPKGRDHLIDGARYFEVEIGMGLDERPEYKEEEDENFRGARISDDFPGLDDHGRGGDDDVFGEDIYE